ncbi:MAG: hypothetical protein HYW80_00440 [Parcubacteria group bacterium]|nr:hypothetical protein [Parcubacteria group bacterium]
MRTTKEAITWHDISSPTEEDLSFIKETFNPHPVILEELKTPSARQKVELYDDFLFLVLHFPNYQQEKKTSLPVEIDVLVKPDVVATLHYEDVELLDDIAGRCENLAGFKNLCLGETSAEFLYRLIEEVLEFSQRQLRHINEKVSTIEEAVFSGREKEMIKEISVIKRDLLDFRRILRPFHGILESLEKRGVQFYGEEKRIYFADLIGDYQRMDTIESLETTNQTLLSSKIDEVMRLISILAFLLTPFTIIGTLFQINTQFTPIIGNPYDWWIVTFLTILGSIFLYFYFKRRKWL